MFKKIAKIFGAAPTKAISGEMLYEHLKNIGIDAEVIPEGSPDDTGRGRGMSDLETNQYSFSIKVKGIHIDVIQINGFLAAVGGTRVKSSSYRIDYIIRDSGQKIENLHGNLEKKQKRTLGKEWVVLDWPKHCVRIFGVPVYASQTDTLFPSLDTLEDYDKKAWWVRRMLESGHFVPMVDDPPAHCAICDVVQAFPISSLKGGYFSDGVVFHNDSYPDLPHSMYVCEKCRSKYPSNKAIYDDLIDR